MKELIINKLDLGAIIDNRFIGLLILKLFSTNTNNIR